MFDTNNYLTLANRVSGPYRILVVDDMATNRLMVRAILEAQAYQVTEADSGEHAIELLLDGGFDAVVLDVLMPGMNGFDVCLHIRHLHGQEFLPVIMLTSLGSPDDVARGFECGATDFITKPYNNIELVARVKSAAQKKRLIDRLDDTESVLFALARMVEAKDQNTRDHCDRLSHMAVVFGRSLGYGFEELDALRRGGILHDIGKLGIPDAVLLKNGPLNDSEWMVMRQHPVIGAELCRPLRSMKKTVDIIHFHHERWNGSGYPQGLREYEIPELARVFQIVDVYDALSTERPYKPALPVERVVEIMEQESDKGFWDPDLVERFMSIVRETPEKLELPADAHQDPSARIFDSVMKRDLQDWDRG